PSGWRLCSGQGAARYHAAARGGLGWADLAARRAGRPVRSLSRPGRRAGRSASCRRHAESGAAGRYRAGAAIGHRGPLVAAPARSGDLRGIGLAEDQAARAAGRAGTAAGDFRPCRLGRTECHHRRGRRAGSLGHPWPRGGADARGVPARHPGAGVAADRLRRRRPVMNRFAALLESLIFTPGRNAKLARLADYFATTPDPDRGWALAALTGKLSIPGLKSAAIRQLAESRSDPVLFGWSYDYVGDLAETVALIWPEHHEPGETVPTLTEVVEKAQAAGRSEAPKLLADWL